MYRTLVARLVRYSRHVSTVSPTTPPTPEIGPPGEGRLGHDLSCGPSRAPPAELVLAKQSTGVLMTG